MCKNAVIGNMGIVECIQPHVPVNARAFVEPAFVLRCIGPDHQHIIRPKTQKIGYIVGYSDVAAFVVAEVKAIDPELRIAENAVELHLKTFAFFRFCKRKMFPVPADARSGIIATQRLVTVRHDVECRVVDKGQFDRPVVRQVDRTPQTILEPRFDGSILRAARFGQNSFKSVIEVFFRVVGMAETEFPVAIEILTAAGLGGK